MPQRLFRLTPLLAALILTACMGTENRGLESIHQPVVARADYLFDVAAGPQGLARGEAVRLAGWMESMRLGYGDSVAIDDPTGYPVARATVTGIVAGRGLLLARQAPPVGAPVTPGTIRVVVSRLHASVPGCPDWSRDESTEFNSNTSSNQGCATNSNLAAMIANPGDLVRGQSGSGVADPQDNFRAIDAYRKAVPSGGGGANVKAAPAGGGK